MRPASHQEEEREFLRRFQGNCPDCPPGAAVRPELPQEGDWHFERPQGRLVVEIVKFIPDREAQAVAVFRDEVEARVRADLRTRLPTRGVHMLVTWQQTRVGKVNRKQFATSLLECILARVPEPGQRVEVEWDDLAEALQDHVGKVRLVGLPRVYPSDVVVGRGFWVTSDVERLQAVIDQKRENLRTYRAAGSEVWLLVVASWETDAALLRTREGIADAVFEAGFDRVYLLDCWDNSVQRLVVSPPGADPRSARGA